MALSVKILFSLLLCSFTTVLFVECKGITLDLFHRDSPSSPSYDPSHTRFDRLKRSFDRSFTRKSALTLTSDKKSTLDSFNTKLTPIGGEYLMKISIGTPPVEQLGIADTGSDLTWTQCKPCTQCYKQNTPLFDPTTTSSYRQVSCDSQTCSAVGSGSTCNSQNGCQYQVSYGDRSYSIGDLAVETLTFGDTSSSNSVSFPKVVFGCGHQNDGTFSQTGSGIVGLGGGSVSIINQLQKSIGGKFSYCLSFLDSNASSTISFGENAVVAGPNVVSTPLVKKDPDTFYYLTLKGVSVGEEKFEYIKNNKKSDDYDFEGPTSTEGNIIIDSGTTLTFLPSELYSGLEEALAKGIKGTRGSDSRGMFNLCYELPSDGQFSSPSVVAHFDGGDVVLPEGSTFVEVEKGLVCLTLLPSQDLAIFGNLHQMNHRIGYDLVNKQVNFLATDCSKAG